ncbi:MAG: sigma-70 family RNA polymerase sigma factor [Capsulimonadales bacterium]|nr:sigma-70 family RNA polymerase sigma factor [Capsulimonadales bacterium]
MATGAPPRREATGRPDEEQIARLLNEYVRRRDRCQAKGRSRDTLSLIEIKSQIAHHYTSLVESVARRFLASGEPQEDLVQEGFLGLLSALENYDSGKGVKFSTYATHFIAGAIRHCLRDRGKIIKEPAWLQELSHKINRTQDALHQSLGRTPHPGEIARVLNLTEESVEEVLATRQVFQVASFATASDDGDESMVGLVDPEKIRSDRHVTLQLPIEDRIVLDAAAGKLKALEQNVLHEFFYKDLSQTEIARKMGISCNYVSHILKNSTQKLRRILGEAEIRDRNRSAETSIIDPASGLFTAGHILARLDEEISRSARSGQVLAVVVMLLEGIPAAGIRREEVWNLCGSTVRESIRRVDIAGRYGHDGLVVILPQTGAAGMVVAERLLDILMSAGAAHHTPFTVRIGFAMYPEQCRTGRDLIALAANEANFPEENLPVPASAGPVVK